MNASALPGYTLVSEPELAFDPVREEDRHLHPLVGLVEFGPYSRKLLAQVSDPIRVALIGPKGELGKVRSLIAELERRHEPRERRVYLQTYLGFSRVFGVRLVTADKTNVELPSALEDDLARAARPEITLAEAVTHALNALQPHRTDFDVVAIYLPERWSRGFWSADGGDFDLHDFLKGMLAARGVPMQMLNDAGMDYSCRCSVAWRLGIAFYTKAGGIPWKLAEPKRDTAFIGISFAVKQGEAPRFITCCSQVFDADGGGLEFIAYETSGARVYGDNPYLSRADMRRVLARSLAIYQRRHAGRSPTRIVVHKTTPFKHEEVDGAFDALGTLEDLNLVQVQDDVAWRAVRLDAPKGGGTRGEPANYPCGRGTVLALGDRDWLVWTQGTIELDGKTFFKEGKSIPTPLLLSRFAGHLAPAELAYQVMGLSKMNWNNDSLYDRLPVTLGYAKVLANVVKRLETLAPLPYQFRFFM